MQLKQYLIEAFEFNDIANKKLLCKIKLLRNAEESVKLFSHLINTQDKWMAKIMQHADYEKTGWWEPIYHYDKLEEEWDKSTNLWISYLTEKTDEELLTEAISVEFDNAVWSAILKDIALQLIYHSVHHRAQIQMMIRQEGIEPDFLDYIGTKVKKLNY
jgi:uncharacterized damage-inducible protein DinB